MSNLIQSKWLQLAIWSQWFRCGWLCLLLASAIASLSYEIVFVSVEILVIVIANLLLRSRIGIGCWLSLAYNILGMIAGLDSLFRIKFYFDPHFYLWNHGGKVLLLACVTNLISMLVPLFALLFKVRFEPPPSETDIDDNTVTGTSVSQ